MLEEAVNELAGEQAALTAPVRVDLPVTAYVPPEYIAYEATKIDAHRRIARARTIGELGDVRADSPIGYDTPSRWRTSSRCRRSGPRRRSSEQHAVAYRGSRLQVDGLDLDDESAARVRRTSNDRATFFKKDRMLAVHREGQEPPLLRWVEATLDAILASRVSHDRSSISGRENL